MMYSIRNLPLELEGYWVSTSHGFDLEDEPKGGIFKKFS